MNKYERRKLEAATRVNKLHILKLRIESVMMIAVVICVTFCIANAIIPDNVLFLSIQVLASFIAAMSQAPLIVIQRELYPEYTKSNCLGVLSSVILAVLWSRVFVIALKDLIALT